MALRIILLERGTLASEVAADLKVHPAHLSQVINGHRRSGRIRLELAKRFGDEFLRLLLPWGKGKAVHPARVNPRGPKSLRPRSS